MNYLIIQQLKLLNNYINNIIILNINIFLIIILKMLKTYPNKINHNKNIKKYKRKIIQSNNFSNTDLNFFINSNNNSIDFNDENEKNFTKTNTFNSNYSSNKKIAPIKRKLFMEKSKTYTHESSTIKEKGKRNNDIWFKEIINKIQKINLNSLQKIQNDFIKELNEIYSENLNKIEEVNKKYKNEIHEISLQLDNENIENNEKYIELMNEKNEALEEIESVFIIKKNCSLLKYNDRIIKLKENIIKGINEEGVNIREEIINKFCLNNNIKQKIPSCINFQEKRKKN